MFPVGGGLPVDAGALMVSDQFFKQFAGLASVMTSRPSWSGFDEAKTKGLRARLVDDYGRQAPLTMYREADKQGISFSEYLEQEDPSPRDTWGNLLVPGDAFERQLTLAANEMGGPFGSITLEQFYKGEAAVLLPELLRRWIQAGISMKGTNVDRLIAVTSKLSGTAFKPVYIPTGDVDTETNMGAAGSGGTGALPTLKVQYRDKSIDSQVFGRVVDVAYRVIQHSPMSKIEMIYKFVGLNIANSLVGSVYTTLKSGDGSSAAISGDYAITGGTGGGTLTYADMINTFLAVDELFEVNALICRKAVMVDVLTLSQFQDPEADFKFQKDADLSSFRPLGSQLYRYDSATDHEIIALDARWAVEKAVEQELKIETDKIISQQFEETAITESHAYAVLMDGARAKLDFS